MISKITGFSGQKNICGQAKNNVPFKGTAYLSAPEKDVREIFSSCLGFYDCLKEYFHNIKGKYIIDNKEFKITYPKEIENMIEPMIVEFAKPNGFKAEFEEVIRTVKN